MSLRYDNIDPVAEHGLAGLIRDRFIHGRLNATVGAHGGLLEVGYFGQQTLSHWRFFRGDAESAWVKLFRLRVRIGETEYYLTMNNTRLLSFGYVSSCEIAGVQFVHELLLLRDTLVHRVRVVTNEHGLPIRIGMVHQEACTAVDAGGRTWGEFAFAKKHNALIVSCRDMHPVGPGDLALAQRGLKVRKPSGAYADTWIGASCDTPLSVKRGYHARSKYYIESSAIGGNDTAFFVTFAGARQDLTTRLAQLRLSVHDECDALLAAADARQAARPTIDVGDAILNSAFGQYPEIIEGLKLPDRSGAVRAGSHYFVWGWDGLTPTIPCAFSNEAAYTAEILRFWASVRTPDFGLPLGLTTAFTIALKEPFPAQCQYIAGLYHYIAATGDLALAEELYGTCKLILDKCAKDEVKGTGLVSGNALWPDFPEAMEEDGDDISSLNNSFLYQGLRAMEYIAAAIGKADAARKYGAWARRLRANFVKYLFDAEQGYFISSCSSITLKPRKHYCCQAVFWITPFARELVSHDAGRIAAFMDQHLRSDKCLLSLPMWDTAWMADGNQLGSSFPTADYFYLNVHKLLGDAAALDKWLSDVAWYWQYHHTPEAFTPEASNEAELGPDNPGGKQLQSTTSWYACVYMGLAGIDIDHEGITFTPWGDRPIAIRGLKLHGATIDLEISGAGSHIGSLTVNGDAAPAGSRKISWASLTGRQVQIELERTKAAPAHPVLVRADGLRVTSVGVAQGELRVGVTGDMSGEVVIQTASAPQVAVNGIAVAYVWDEATRTVSIPCAEGAVAEIVVRG